MSCPFCSVDANGGPEVGFGEVAIDLREARFWIVSGLPTTRPERAEEGERQEGTDYVRRSAGGDPVRLFSISSKHRPATSFTRKPIFG